MVPESQVCSADHFFTNAAGQYSFDPSRLPQAHAACMKKFIHLVTGFYGHTKVTILRGIPGSGKSTLVQRDVNLGIVVDNTNTTLFEVAPYATIALAYGLTLDIVNFICDPVVAAARNNHGVPLNACKTMAERMERSNRTEMWPAWWPQRTIGG